MKLLFAVPTMVAGIIFYAQGVYLGFSELGPLQGAVHLFVPMIALQHGLGHDYGFWP